MAQVAIHEAKKVLRREIKKRVAAMTGEAKLKESKSIVNKVSCYTEYLSQLPDERTRVDMMGQMGGMAHIYTALFQFW